MRFERFKNIVQYNMEHQMTMKEKVQDFREKVGITQERNLPNLRLFSRDLLEKEHYMVVEIPFCDEEIGALSFRKRNGGYILLNSALPRINVNFALAHELYHVLYQNKTYGRTVEQYISERYGDYEEEHEANLFAGMLMMPSTVFQYVMARFLMEQSGKDTELTVFVKLMSYFEVPYMAVLIRCCELKLFTHHEAIEHLLNVDKKMLEKEFARLWLNEELLCPTFRDEYEKFRSFVIEKGAENVESGLMSEYTTKKIIKKMDSIYHTIRRDGHAEN